MMIGDLINPLMPTLMISLHPENVTAIKQGHKQIEYRKRFFKDAFQAFVCTTGKMAVLNCLSSVIQRFKQMLQTRTDRHDGATG